jgi:predicted nucleic acid-binding protein
VILLDTNVVSELRKAAKANASVTAWAAAQPTDTLFVSTMTVLELEIGIRRMERRDRRQGGVLRQWLDSHVLPAFEGRVLAFDLAVARRCAPLHVPDPRPERDAIIAATALVHGLTLATRNVADFRAMGVKLVDPWGG